MNELNCIFKMRLNEVLADRNMSQVELGRKAGLSEETVGRWFSKGELPNSRSLKQICEVLGESADYLLAINEEGILTRRPRGGKE